MLNSRGSRVIAITAEAIAYQNGLKYRRSLYGDGSQKLAVPVWSFGTDPEQQNRGAP